MGIVNYSVLGRMLGILTALFASLIVSVIPCFVLFQISGLPEHLLPKPPKRTSPCFEKLKRALSRSPSPVNQGRISPLSFLNRPVSPLVPAVGERKYLKKIILTGTWVFQVAVW